MTPQKRMNYYMDVILAKNYLKPNDYLTNHGKFYVFPFSLEYINKVFDSTKELGFPLYEIGTVYKKEEWIKAIE
jgi:hypothetical protein